MKENRILILLLIVFCISFVRINPVYADYEDSFNISCDKNTLEVNEIVDCKVTGYTTHVTSGVIASLSSNSNLEITNIVNISPFHVIDSEPIFYFGDAFPAGNINIVSFKAKALRAGTGNLFITDYAVAEADGLGFVDEDAETFYDAAPVNYNITITNGGDEPTPKSSDSSLLNLQPDIGTLIPEFTSTNLNYSMSINFLEYRRVKFTPTKNHPAAIVSGSDCTLPNNTSVASVTCKISVIAEDNSRSVYSITINNSSYVEPVIPAEITKITTNDGLLTPAFSKDVLNYTMNINFLNFDNVSFKITFADGNSSTQKCDIPKSSSVESVICTIDKYNILIKNTNSPDIKCDLVIKSNVYTIDQTKKIIKVNSEHSLDTIKSNLYSSCGEIKVFNDKVTISDNSNIVEYKLEKLIMPQTGNNLIIYPLAIVSVLVIIGLFIFIKKKYFKKEM